MKRGYGILKVCVLLLGIALLGVACKPGASYPPDRDGLEAQPIREGVNPADDETGEEVEDPNKVYTLQTIAKHEKAQKLHIAEVLKSGIVNTAPFLEKLQHRGLTQPQDLPEAVDFLQYAYLVTQAQEKTKNTTNRTADKNIPEEALVKMVSAAYSMPNIGQQLLLAVKESSLYQNQAVQLPTTLAKPGFESFQIAIQEKGTVTTATLMPQEDTDIKKVELVYEKQGNDFLLKDITVEHDTKTIEIAGLINITKPMELDPYYDFTIVGSIGNTIIAVDYWDTVTTIAALDSNFREIKRVSFEHGRPEVDFRDTRLFLKFPTQVVVLNATLEALYYNSIPEFMAKYQTAFPNPDIRKNTARNLELYSYDISNDYTSYLYSSGYGFYLYHTSTGLQQKIMESEVRNISGSGILYTPERVAFTPDGKTAYGIITTAGNQLVMYDVASKKTTVLTSGEANALALSPVNAKMGSFFNPIVGGLHAIGADFYASATQSGDKYELSVGLLSAPNSTEKSSFATKDTVLAFSALLDDGRVVLVATPKDYGSVQYLCTAAPNLTPISVPLAPPTAQEELPLLPEAETEDLMPQPGDE